MIAASTKMVFSRGVEWLMFCAASADRSANGLWLIGEELSYGMILGPTGYE